MSSIELPYVLLKPVETKPLPKDDILIIYEVADLQDLNFIWEGYDPSDYPMALDYETRGTDAEFNRKISHRDEFEIVGIGLADKRGAMYINLKYLENRDEILSHVLNGLAENNIPLMAYNLIFEGSASLSEMGGAQGKWLNWKHDVFVSHKHLASEGFQGQQWGLKKTTVNLLGWDEQHDIELDDWLRKHGYCTKVKVKKSEMHRAPIDILGTYCALDAYATRLLYIEVILPVFKRFPRMFEYHEWTLKLVELTCRQQLRGMKIDLDNLKKYHFELQAELKKAEIDFLNHESVKDYIEEYNSLIVQAVKDAEPKRYKAHKPIPEEPKQRKKNGEFSQAWFNWVAKLADWERRRRNPETTLGWLNWRKKLDEVENINHFKISSASDKKWLFYDKMRFPVLKLTESDQPAVDGDALMGFGEAGKLADKYGEISKELQYVSKCIEKTDELTQILHAHWIVPGTITGRAAGAGGFSIHQVVKTAGFLSKFKARHGHIIIGFDFSSLEPHVMAEITQDKAKLNLYGPNAKKQDIYLYFGANSSMGKPLRDAGYDPNNPPNEEDLERYKKEFKDLRNIFKKCVLSLDYGCGVKKLYDSLILSGVNISMDEAAGLHKDYWKLYSGVKKYDRWAEEVLRKTGGWLLNPIGRPIAIAEDKYHDKINRLCIDGDAIILTKAGFKKLKDLRDIDLVWDGISFVKHSGLINKGIQATIEVGNINMTPDHKLLTIQGEWVSARDIRMQNLREGSKRYFRWCDVWSMVSEIIKLISSRD